MNFKIPTKVSNEGTEKYVSSGNPKEVPPPRYIHGDGYVCLSSGNSL